MNELQLAMKEFGLKFDEPFSLKLKCTGYIIGPYTITNSKGADDNPGCTIVVDGRSGTTFDKPELLVDVVSGWCEVVDCKEQILVDKFNEQIKTYKPQQFFKDYLNMCYKLCGNGQCNECGIGRELNVDNLNCVSVVRNNVNEAVQATLRWTIQQQLKRDK